MPLVPLQSDRLVIRALTLEDAVAVFAILGHGPTTAGVSFGLSTAAEAQGYVERRLNNEAELGYSMWAVELRGSADLIGLCGFLQTDEVGRAELGYVVHASHWGQGIGREAARMAVDAARDAGYEIVAIIRSTNERSLRIAAGLGMVRTGSIDDDRGTKLVFELAGVEQPLDGGWQTEVRRRGGAVLRSPGPQSPTVMRLLRHLRDAGFDAAPGPVGSGFADDGREQLEFIEGRSPQPLAWGSDAVWRIGHLLRQLHDATASFDPGPDAAWRPWFARSLPGQHPVIGHGDLGPWNILARQGAPVAFIDWDNAGPVDAMWELAQVVWLNAQLHEEDVAAENDLPSPHDRMGQAAALLDGYQLAAGERVGLVDKMIEFAIRSARDEAVARGVGPETSSPADDGFPLLWAVTWRTRAAAWMLEHRTQLVSRLETI